jgi:5,10-methylene-tetrahydrofolate dehydrogenase/methenyl tetrahydrofolate cyclohydrolase
MLHLETPEQQFKQLLQSPAAKQGGIYIIPKKVKILIQTIYNLKLEIFTYVNTPSKRKNINEIGTCYEISPRRNPISPYVNIKGVPIHDEIRSTAVQIIHNNKSTENILIHTRAHKRIDEIKIQQYLQAKSVTRIENTENIQFGIVTPFSHLEWTQVFDIELWYDTGMPLTTNAHHKDFGLEIPSSSLKKLIAMHPRMQFADIARPKDKSSKVIDISKIATISQSKIGIIGGNPINPSNQLVEEVSNAAHHSIRTFINNKPVDGGDHQQPQIRTLYDGNLGKSMAYPRLKEKIKTVVLTHTKDLLNQGTTTLALYCFTNAIHDIEIKNYIEKFRINKLQKLTINLQKLQISPEKNKEKIMKQQEKIIKTKNIKFVSLQQSILKMVEHEKNKLKGKKVLVLGGSFTLDNNGPFKKQLEEIGRKSNISFIFTPLQKIMEEVKQQTGTAGSKIKQLIIQENAQYILPLGTEISYALSKIKKDFIYLDTLKHYARDIIHSTENQLQITDL